MTDLRYIVTAHLAFNALMKHYWPAKGPQYFSIKVKALPTHVISSYGSFAQQTNMLLFVLYCLKYMYANFFRVIIGYFSVYLNFRRQLETIH